MIGYAIVISAITFHLVKRIRTKVLSEDSLKKKEAALIVQDRYGNHLVEVIEFEAEQEMPKTIAVPAWGQQANTFAVVGDCLPEPTLGTRAMLFVRENELGRDYWSHETGQVKTFYRYFYAGMEA